MVAEDHFHASIKEERCCPPWKSLFVIVGGTAFGWSLIGVLVLLVGMLIAK